MQDHGKPFFQLDLRCDYNPNCPPVSSAIQDSYWLPMDGIIDADDGFHDIEVMSKQGSVDQVFSDLIKAQQPCVNVKQEEILESPTSFASEEKPILPTLLPEPKEEEQVAPLPKTQPKQHLDKTTRHIKKKRR